VLLVGPPGTGKTLLARAVAGEAGVPFLSVSGSDFMEMFVGVGASRVRDLFQTARKQAPAIIFVDEIDSIGRKRGAGLGGGHDEREQTLNQMLNEMDGFDTSEGVVMMAATNRPDILDPALLRPGRFDRQIVVPLPDLDERLPILQVHARDKRIGPDVDLAIIARGTPGMSGADLANLVNEAALHAVRRGSQLIEMKDFDQARDRVLMGQQRDSLVLSESERERVSFHESGHALLSYVLPFADPLLKVSIIPTGMALGVTQQLPLEERHIYPREYIEDSLCVRMGGRVAELLVYGDLSTGASDDLQRNTELARKMVREWGMSDRVGPMAWGAQGTVFLGEDLMHSRDYSEDTSRVVDEEVSRILREQEDRARRMLEDHRAGLEAVARELLEKETVEGARVAQLIDSAFGSAVHGENPEVAHVAMGMSPSFEEIAPASAGAGDVGQSSGMATEALNPTDPLDPLA
jgi:cell division protease FtsH